MLSGTKLERFGMRLRVGKQQDLVRFAIRLPKRLHKGLADFAFMYDRSLNYEIEVRLETSFDLDRWLDAPNPEEEKEILAKLRSRLRGLRLSSESN